PQGVPGAGALPVPLEVGADGEGARASGAPVPASLRLAQDVRPRGRGGFAPRAPAGGAGSPCRRHDGARGSAAAPCPAGPSAWPAAGTARTSPGTGPSYPCGFTPVGGEGIWPDQDRKSVV